MIVASNQPYFLPYIGYWQLLNMSDVYVISDSMQYIKKGYVNRNYILIDGKRHIFTLEALGVHSDKLINEIEVGNNTKKILKSIFSAYKKAPHFEKIYPMMEQILLHDEKNLAKFLGYSIERISRYLDMDTKIIYLSDLQGETTLIAEDRTIDICKRLKADNYVNAMGGQSLYSKEHFREDGLSLSFLNPKIREYKQYENEFVPKLSIIDILMFNSKDEIEEMLKDYTLI